MIGSSFAASVTYNSNTNSIMITGSTFGQYFSSTSTTTTSSSDNTKPRRTSNCFLASIVLPTSSDSDSTTTTTTKQLHWSTQQIFGENEDIVNEACSITLFSQSNKNKLYTLGFSEVGGIYDSLFDGSTVNDVKHYGMLLDINVDTTGSTTSTSTPYQLIGGRVLQDTLITYPIVATTSTTDDYIYVVSQVTDSASRQETSSTSSDSTNEFVNTTTTLYDISSEVDPMRYFKYGENYKMALRRFRNFQVSANPTDNNNELPVTFAPNWYRIYPTITNDAVHVTGMIIINDIIFVIGSTYGDGAAYGGINTGTASDNNTTESAFRGFITKFHTSNGTLVNDDTVTSIKGTRRIEAIDGGRVWTAGLCYNADKESNMIYIVGATEGPLTKNDIDVSDTVWGVDGYVMKINTDTLEQVWVQQLTGINPETMIRGVSCAVSKNENSIWIGGVVQDDGVILHSDTTSSYGGDDIFITKLDTETGNHILTRQIGSTEDDGLAMRGGIILDSNDNCIIVGNTYGSMYRVRSKEEVDSIANDNADDDIWISDVFVTTVNGKDGTIAYPISHPEYVPQPSSGSNGESTPNENDSSIEKTSSKKRPVLIMVILFLIIGIPSLIYCIRYKAKSNRDVNTDRSKVIAFLNDFDVDDIDLKHSATGGWHCFYSNELARGHNNNRRNSNTTNRDRILSSSASSTSSSQSSSYNGINIERSIRSNMTNDPLLTTPLTNSNLIKESLFMCDDDDDNNSNINYDDDDDRSSNNNFGSHRFHDTGSTSRHQPGYSGLLSECNSNYDDQDNTNVWGKEIL
jgi:hypothetical protein